MRSLALLAICQFSLGHAASIQPRASGSSIVAEPSVYPYGGGSGPIPSQDSVRADETSGSVTSPSASRTQHQPHGSGRPSEAHPHHTQFRPGWVHSDVPNSFPSPHYGPGFLHSYSHNIDASPIPHRPLPIKSVSIESSAHPSMPPYEAMFGSHTSRSHSHSRPSASSEIQVAPTPSSVSVSMTADQRPSQSEYPSAPPQFPHAKSGWNSHGENHTEHSRPTGSYHNKSPHLERPDKPENNTVSRVKVSSSSAIFSKPASSHVRDHSPKRPASKYSSVNFAHNHTRPSSMPRKEVLASAPLMTPSSLSDVQPTASVHPITNHTRPSVEAVQSYLAQRGCIMSIQEIDAFFTNQTSRPSEDEVKSYLLTHCERVSAPSRSSSTSSSSLPSPSTLSSAPPMISGKPIDHSQNHTIPEFVRTYLVSHNCQISQNDVKAWFASHQGPPTEDVVRSYLASHCELHSSAEPSSTSSHESSTRSVPMSDRRYPTAGTGYPREHGNHSHPTYVGSHGMPRPSMSFSSVEHKESAASGRPLSEMHYPSGGRWSHGPGSNHSMPTYLASHASHYSHTKPSVDSENTTGSSSTSSVATSMLWSHASHPTGYSRPSGYSKHVSGAAKPSEGQQHGSWSAHPSGSYKHASTSYNMSSSQYSSGKNWNTTGRTHDKPAKPLVSAAAGSCGPCTVNAQAGLEWWFPNPIYHNLASISTKRASGTSSFKLVSNTASLDVVSSMARVYQTYSSSLWFDPDQNATMTDIIPVDAPLPTAASTAILTQHNVLPGPTDVFLNGEQLAALYPSSVVTASIAVPAATGAAFTATSSDNVVWYTKYEVEEATATVDQYGAPTCVTATKTYDLQNPYVYTYADPMMTLGAQLEASGPVYPDFLNMIPQSSCMPGTWLAPEPTLVVVVEETYQRGFAILIAHHEVSVTDALSAPTPYSPGPNSGNSGSSPSGASSGSNAGADNGAIPANNNVPGQQQGYSNDQGSMQTVTAIAQIQGKPSTVVLAVESGDVLPTVTVNGIPVIASVENVLPTTNGYAGGCNGACPITIGSQAYTPNAATQYYIAPGQTLTPGGAVMVGGTSVSLASNAQSIVVNGQSQQVGMAPPMITAAPVLVVNGQTQSFASTLVAPTIQVGGAVFTELPGASFAIGSQVLRPGQAITTHGTTISLPAGADSVVINGQTSALLGTSMPAIVAGGATYTAAPGGAYIIAGQTLAPGSSIVVAGTTLSIPAATYAAATAAPMTTNAPVLTIGLSTYTAAAGTSFVIDGQTLTPGGVITDKGITISLAPSATAVVIDGKTQTLFPATGTPIATAKTTVANALTKTGANAATFTPMSTMPAQEGTAARGVVSIATIFVAGFGMILSFLLL